MVESEAQVLRPGLNWDFPESDFLTPRDGLMHMACAFLDVHGFGRVSNTWPVWSALMTLFDTLLELGLQPRAAIYKINNRLIANRPGDDDADGLVRLILDVAEAFKRSQHQKNEGG